MTKSQIPNPKLAIGHWPLVIILLLAAILRLVLQDVGPTITQPLQELPIQPQCLESQSHQIIKIHLIIL